MANPLKRGAKGIVISPDRKIEIHELDVEGTIVWGERNPKRGKPCWVTPDDFRQVKGFPYLILSTVSSVPITFPGENPVQKDEAKLSRAMGEQFAKQSVIAESGSGLTGRLIMLTSFMLITIAFVVATMGMLLPGIVSNYFGS